MLRSFLIAVALLLLAGCSLSGTNESDSRRTINVVASHVDVLSTSRQTVSFKFEGGLPVPCYEFEEAVVNREGQTVRVKVRAHSTADYCVTVTGTLRVSPLEIEIAGEGTYTFQFWRGKQEPLEVEVSVP